MKRFFTIIITSIVFFACKPGIPKDIIQPAKMQKVLFDVHVVDGYISSLPSQDSAKKVASSFYNGVYKKFEIDSAVYNKSLDYYYKHPIVFKKMYDSIIVKLNKLRDANSKFEDVVPENNFMGIFAKNGLDSTVLDFSLNRKYNYRPLKKDVYGASAFSNGSQNSPLQSVPNNPQPTAIGNPQSPKLEQ